jgi:hypothetical protein
MVKLTLAALAAHSAEGTLMPTDPASDLSKEQPTCVQIYSSYSIDRLNGLLVHTWGKEGIFRHLHLYYQISEIQWLH